MDIKQSVITENFKQRLFFALSDPGRYKIVRMLYHVGHEMGCNELNEHVEIDKSTMSYQHFEKSAWSPHERRDGKSLSRWIEKKLKQRFRDYWKGFKNKQTNAYFLAVIVWYF